ncbi:nuclear transition protein 2 [Rhinolophus ferrumequinum]|uniref:nuclear transition protein 2 n=1 Tax=Rhinolophus ferrumequinum TaxID=59479 RepID=UPI00140F6BC9|nr:nuclear transition protein 2 [Rhinolophus ferrumequinum]
MDTKAQNLPFTHTQPHSSSRSQSHTCNHCSCSHHCQNCSPTCSWSQGCRQSQSYRQSRGSSQSPTGHCSPPGPQSQSPRSSPLPKHQKHTMHPQHCPKRPATHSSRYPKNRKNVDAKVNKRKAVKRSRRVYKTKRRSSGTFHAGGEGELPSWTSGAVRRTNQGGRGRGEVASRGPARFLRNSARSRGTPPALLKGSSEACGHKLPLPGKPKPRPGTATGREERTGVGEPPLRVRDTGAGRRREQYRGVQGRDLLAGPQVGWRSLVRGE